MNSISYFYKNLLKKRIKSEINSLTDKCIDVILNSLYDTKNTYKYVSLVSSVQKEVKNLILTIIVQVFEEVDRQYSSSIERKKKYYINKSNVERTLVTIFGEIKFKRTYFVSKLNNNKLFFVDEVFGLPKYDHYDPIVKAMAVDKAMETNQAIAGRDIGERISNIDELCGDRKTYHIQRQTINNWINNWHEPNSVYKETKTPKTLYVMADEKFLGCQDLEGDIMAKCMIAFEDVKRTGKHRKALINKTVLSVYGSNPWGKFVDVLSQKYNFDEIENIKFMGDGANWIMSGVDELRMNPNTNIERLLCQFHYKQAINHITTDKEIRNELLKIFDKGSKKDFENKVLEIKDNITEEKRKQTIDKKLNYILNHYKDIKNMLASPVGSSMESHISHYIASLFASRPKGYSSKKISKYLKLNDYRINGINLFNLYLQSYNNTESIIINKDELNYSIFEKKEGIPILKNGEITGLYNSINALVH